MKLVRYLGIFMLFFIAAVFGMMVLSPKEMKHNLKVEVNAPIEEVFEAATNVHGFKEWQNGMVEVRDMRGDMTQKGNACDLIYKNSKDQEMVLHHEITDYVKNEHYKAKQTVKEYMSKDFEMEFEAVDSNTTKVIGHITIRPESMPARLFMYNKDGTKERDQAQFDALKEAIENR